MGCCSTNAVIEKRNMTTQTQASTSLCQSQLISYQCDAQILKSPPEEDTKEIIKDKKTPHSPQYTTTNLQLSYIVSRPEVKSDYIKIKVPCDVYETCPSIWVKANETLKFRVFGEWSPDPSLPKCNSKGIPTYTMSDFNYGALVARVLGEEYFGVYDFSVYTSNREGPLFLKMFSPRFNLKSTGFVTVHLYGGEVIDKKELNRRIGWNTKIIYSNISECNLNIVEEEIIVDLNKMRCNPNLYSIQYINIDRVKTNKFLNEKTKRKPFLINQKLNDLISEFCKGYYKMNFLKKESLSYLSNLEEYIGIFLRDQQIGKLQIFCKLYDDCLPHKISMKLLQHELIREYIFTKEFEQIGLKLLEVEKGFILFLILNDESTNIDLKESRYTNDKDPTMSVNTN